MFTLRFLSIFIIFTITTSNLSAAIISIPDITVEINNDDYVGTTNPNNTWYGIGWSGTDGWSGSGFDIVESGGTTEYQITISVTNMSGINWDGYSMELALGINPDSTLNYSSNGDGLDFDSVDSIFSSDPLISVNYTEDRLLWEGFINNNESVDLTFSIDVPDGLGVSQIWLIEKPVVVPAPASFLLLVSGLVGMLLFPSITFRKSNTLRGIKRVTS